MKTASGEVPGAVFAVSWDNMAIQDMVATTVGRKRWKSFPK